MTPWATFAEVQERAGNDALTDDLALLAITIASELISQLSGNQFGTVERTVRPVGCGTSCDWTPSLVGWGLAPVLGPWPLPGPYGGLAACCGCGCWSTPGVVLDGPVVWDEDHPISVTVNGDELTDWVRLDDERGAVLVRTDGLVFPACQNLRLASTEPGTFQVVYTRGVAVPGAGKQAAISLAIEYARLNKWMAGTTCLPQRVTTITRQGVSMVAIDPMDIIANGGTGLTDVDLFISAYNPNKLRHRARIFTPNVRDSLPRVRSSP